QENAGAVSGLALTPEEILHFLPGPILGHMGQDRDFSNLGDGDRLFFPPLLLARLFDERQFGNFRAGNLPPSGRGSPSWDRRDIFAGSAHRNGELYSTPGAASGAEWISASDQSLLQHG